jgi:hypothetical protein
MKNEEYLQKVAIYIQRGIFINGYDMESIIYREGYLHVWLWTEKQKGNVQR